MTNENRDYLEMTFRSIECFADDGRLDVGELQTLISIAQRDGVVDGNEKRVLRNIFSRLNEDDLTPEMLAKIDHIRQDLGI